MESMSQKEQTIQKVLKYQSKRVPNSYTYSFVN